MVVKTAEEVMLPQNLSGGWKWGGHSKQRNSMSKAQEQETAESVWETANSVWPKQEERKSKH